MEIIENINEGLALSEGWTYIFRSRDEYSIKIGQTIKKLTYRLNTVRKLGNYESYDMEFLFAVKGGEYEKVLHNHFESMRTRYHGTRFYYNENIHYPEEPSNFRQVFCDFSAHLLKGRLRYSSLHLNLNHIKQFRTLLNADNDVTVDFSHIKNVDDATAEPYFLDPTSPSRLELFRFEERVDKKALIQTISDTIHDQKA